MRETRATMTDLRQRLADLINRAAYGGERVVLVSHGEPKAAIIGIDELHRLEQLDVDASRHEHFERALAKATRIREKIREWQEANNIVPDEDSVETLRRLREERDEELSGLR